MRSVHHDQPAVSRPLAATRLRAPHWLTLVALGLVFSGLAGARAVADRPWNDEAWFVSPALNLIQHGHLGTSILEGRSYDLPGLSEYTYWVMPLYLVSLAGWFAAFPVCLLSMRAFSVLCCGLGIVAFCTLAWRARGEPLVVMLTALMLATDFVLIRAGSVGRMDAMSASLGFAAIAVYAALRLRNLALATGMAGMLGALSWLTHPVGIAHTAGVVVVAVWLDWRRLRFVHGIAFVLPHALAFGAWALYIAQAPQYFWPQFSSNVGNRFDLLQRPWSAIAREWQRYFGGPGRSAMEAFKVSLLLPYAAGLVMAVASRSFRRTIHCQILLLMVLICAATLVVLDSRKVYLYAVHVIPYSVALTAAAVALVWQGRRVPRAVVAAFIVVLVLVQLSGTIYTINRDSYHRDFLPGARDIVADARAGRVVMGSAELAFVTGFDARVVDDVALGFHTGLMPDVVVVESRYRDDFAYVGQRSPEVADHISAVLAGLPARKRVGSYEIYRRSP